MGIDDTRKLVNNCEKATFLIEKRKYTTLSFGDRMMLHTHLAGCCECRIYAQQSDLIDQLSAGIKPAELPVKSLGDDLKQKMQDAINKQLNGK